jgi:hypothetical protein
VGLLHFQIAPFAAQDRFSNLCGCFALFRHLFGKEDLLDADKSTGTVV